MAHDYETDPIAAGFVGTLARPGGNITGMFFDLPEITGKLLELLKTTLPGLQRIGVLWDPFTGKAQVLAVERAAKALDIEINILEARAGSLEQTVRSAADRRAGALLLLGSPVLSADFRRSPRPRRPRDCRPSLSFLRLPGPAASWPTAQTPRISIDRKDE